MKALHLLTALTCVVASASATAQYWSTLADTPVSRFNDTDNKLMMATVNKALKEGVDGTPIEWKNEKTPAAGVVTPEKTYQAGGQPCRDLRVANSYKSLKGEGIYQFCKNASGQWKLVR